MNGRVVIRKYENRRLYDTSASRYVNLEEIARMVREGVDIQVVDARTGEDVTRSILTQIIVEDSRNRGAGLPLDFLRELVIASGRAGQETLAGYLRLASQMLQNPGGSTANPFDLLSRFIPGAAATRENTEIAELRRRLDELEGELRNSRQAGRSRRKRTEKRT